jgi:hypothetical protein
MFVLIGPGNPGPPLAVMVGLLRNFGGWVREVKEESVGGPMRPLMEVVDVRCDQGESLIARLASLTVRWSGFISCFTSELRRPMFRPSPVLAAASSPHA